VIVDEHHKYFQLVKYSLSAACYRALWNIGNGIEFIYNHYDPALPGQMAYLYNSGYIQPRHGGFLVFDQSIHGADMTQYFKPTPIGEYLIGLRGDPSLG
jgi:predicted dehydrogenase